MAVRYYAMALVSVCLLLHLLLVKCRSPLAPALYVFGDSLADCENNNFLQTQVKVNFKPYGIDFPLGVTGRFSNGKTFADFIAQFLGLPFVPAYLSLSAGDKIKIRKGVNYASGAAGILDETGSALGETLSFDDQIKYFQDTVKSDLPKIFKTRAKLSKYLAKSIFYISMGSNDYINNYLQPANYNSSRTYDPQQYADFLVDALKQRLTKLYNLGAKKFLVFNIGPLGCIPGIVNSVNPKPTTPCVEDVNNLVKLFNVRLPSMIQKLQSTLSGSTFVLGDSYTMSYNMNQNPSKYGFIGGRIPCCIVGGDGACIRNQAPCHDRTKYLYWDAFHPSEALMSGFANNCFNGSSTCVPINVKQLAHKPYHKHRFLLK